MKKHLFYPCLLGILTLTTLSSCRTEDGAITQKQLEDKRFAVFVPKSSETVNYANGFAYLMQRYDNLHKTNLTGVVNNNPVIGNLNASTNKNASITQPYASYVEFRIHSQTVTGKDGDKWVVFPKIEGNRVTGLILAFLSNKETNVSYKTIDSQTEWYSENIGKFQDAFTSFQKRIKFLNLSASINPMADGAGCKNQNGEYVDCGIQEVIITVPKDPGTPLPPVTIITPIINPGTCNDFQNCTPGGGGGVTPLPEIDPCNNARLNNIKAKEFLSIEKISNAKNVATQSISTDQNEKSFSFGMDYNGVYQTTDIKEGAGGSTPMTVTAPNLTIEGGAHTHTTAVYNVPSSGDIYRFYTAHLANNNFNYYYTFAQGNNNYVYTIVNQTAFDNFITNYPEGTNFDMTTQNWSTNSQIGKDFKAILDSFQNSQLSDDEIMELSMATIINKYDMGIALSKADNNGDFKTIFTEAVPNPNNPNQPFYQRTADCNFKK